MKKRKVFSEVVFALLAIMLAGCKASQTPVPTPGPTIEPTKESGLIYETVFDKDDFKIKEAPFGTADNWLENFTMPSARICDAIPDLGLEDVISAPKYSRCEAELKATGWCTDTINIATAEGAEIRYDLVKNGVGLMGGYYKLKRNGEIIWERELLMMTVDPILSSKRIGDGIAIEYDTINHEKCEGCTIHSIVYAQANSVIDILTTTTYAEVFAPNEIRGKIAYFAKRTPLGPTVFLFDGKELVEYDRVFNLHCCWDGPPVQVIGNGQIVDFFARKGDFWYHVQAGYWNE